ncbi:MAG: hypothetical protein IJ225_09135 [Solobacterium sp.]|nr:hypothetical protein [Solobacterium sp.]
MRKLLSVLLAVVLLGGCKKADTTESDLEVSSNQFTSSSTEPWSPGISYGRVAQKTEEIGAAIAAQNWEVCSSLFAVSSDALSSEELRTMFHAIAEGPYELLECDPIYHDGYCGGMTLLRADTQELEVMVSLNQSLEIETMNVSLRNEVRETEESEEWTEILIEAGNAPTLHGILTLPEGVESPPVAVLVGEQLSDEMNASGSNRELRRDLAHQLAEHGVASVRFNTRLYEESALPEVFGYDLDLLFYQDLASIIHSLESYPVNARSIVYVGHGTAGTLGYSVVYHHFEVTGGLVLINAPFTEDGLELYGRSVFMEEAELDEVRDLLEQEGEDDDVLGLPRSYWADWNRSGALRYTRYVAIPILIQQGEDDVIVTEHDDYDSWKSQKGSNVTMKTYEDIGHDLRNRDGETEEQIAEDIADWLDGVDINKPKTSASSSAGRKS